MQVHPQGGEKKIFFWEGHNLQGKIVSAPQAEQEVKFLLGGKSWMVGAINLAVLACVLKTTTKKGRQLFKEKMHRKFWLRLCLQRSYVFLSGTDSPAHYFVH